MISVQLPDLPKVASRLIQINRIWSGVIFSKMTAVFISKNVAKLI